MNRRTLLKMSAAALVLPVAPAFAADDAKALTEEAYVYLYPLVKNYLTLYQYAVEEGGPQYKGPFNALTSVDRVYTPADTAIITPNSDTPYSFVVMDLRSEPLVITMPAIDADRYYSMQIIDLYTHNVDYLGTRVDGNEGGDFLITGPGWKGERPAGIKRVIELPTWLGFGLFRTQLFAPDDIENVKKVQAGYKAQGLSAYTDSAAPAPAPAVDWLAINDEKVVTDFWPLSAFLLQFAPPLPWEGKLRESFGALGLTSGAPWPPQDFTLAGPMREMVSSGQEAIFKASQNLADSSKIFGTPEEMKGRYMDRAMAALGGIYGNSAKEALYVMYARDANGDLVDASKHNYVVRLDANALPPVDAFWSMTMYNLPQQLLVDNSIDRYLINSAMLDSLKVNEKQEIVLYLQHESPGPELEPNWLPAPNGPFYGIMRLYLPKPEGLDGRWKRPAIEILQ